MHFSKLHARIIAILHAVFFADCTKVATGNIDLVKYLQFSRRFARIINLCKRRGGSHSGAKQLPSSS